MIIAAAIGLGGSDVLGALATPPAFIRAVLVGASVVLGLALLGRALQRIEAARAEPPGVAVSAAHLGATVRGIRFVFLAVAAFAAAIGWLIGHPLPIVIGLVVAGVDVAETSFLLLVATRREG